MKPTSLEGVGSHAEAIIRGWVDPGLTFQTGGTIADAIRYLTIVGATIVDNGDGTATLVISGGSGSGTEATSSGTKVAVLNNSGQDLIVGDVVVTDGTDDTAVTTTTTAGDTRIAGIVQEPIPDGETGLVLFNGYAALVNAPDAVRGEYALTSTTATEAGSVADRTAGTFAVYLTGTDLPDFATAAVTTTTNDAVTTLDIAMPLSIPVDRFLFMGLWLSSGATSPTVAGWTRAGSTAGFYYFTRTSVGGDTAVASWTGAGVAVATVLLLHSNVVLAAPVEDFAYDSTASAAALAGLSDVAHYAIAGVQADVATPGSGYVRFGGGAAATVGGTIPSISEALTSDNAYDTSITLADVAVGNVLVAVIVQRGSSLPTMTTTGFTLLGSAAAAVNFGNTSNEGYVAIYAKVADTTNPTVVAQGIWRLYEIADANLTDVTVLSATNQNPAGTTVSTNLGTFTSVSGVALMAVTESRGTDQASHSVSTPMTGWTERYDALVDPTNGGDPWAGIGDATLANQTLAASWALTEAAGGQTIGEWGGVAVLFGITNRSSAGTLAGKYIAHSATATSPFSGAPQQNDALFAINLLRDAAPSALLYGPDLSEASGSSATYAWGYLIDSGTGTIILDSGTGEGIRAFEPV